MAMPRWSSVSSTSYTLIRFMCPGPSMDCSRISRRMLDTRRSGTGRVNSFMAMGRSRLRSANSHVSASAPRPSSLIARNRACACIHNLCLVHSCCLVHGMVC